jgi:LAGLIDADG DNA endonuclease family protein
MLSERKPLTLEYVSAFFDGEGSINLSPGMYSIGVSLKFSQVDKRILDEIAKLLSSKGVSGIGVYVSDRTRRHPIHALVIGSNDGVESALTMMLPYLRVKSVQAQFTLDYLRDKITGDEFIKAMNAEVRGGRRAGKIYFVDQPFKRSGGIEKIWSKSLARGRQIFREMAKTPDGHRRFGLNAVERNIARGIETRKKILRLLSEGSKSTSVIWSESDLSRGQVRRLLKELERTGHLRRDRRTTCEPFVWTITENGLRYTREE